MTNDQFNPRIVKGYHCPSHSYCSGDWRLRNPGKWQEILEHPSHNVSFSPPLPPYHGKHYTQGGLILVAMNFNNKGDPWDAFEEISDKEDRLCWREKTLFANAAKFLACLFKDKRLRIDADKYYVFANIIKCSPSNQLSKRSWPSLVQLHRCVAVEGHIKHEIEDYNPGILLCLGYEVYNHIMALYVDERLRLGEAAKPQNSVVRLDEDTLALSLPHLSGGMQSFNTQNKQYREGIKTMEHISSLRGKDYATATAFFEAEDAPRFDKNIVLTAMAYDMGRTLKDMAPAVYQRIQDQLAER
ncbi:hypothetical protein ES703_94000 [subsurface metagenome]